MEGMIYFRGVALESVAPVKIEDIMISPIQLQAVARQRPIRFGSRYVRMTGGARTINITFGLLTDEMDTRATQLDAITNWARSQEEERLELPGHENRYLKCVCTELPEPSTRQWWESRLRLVFTCYDDPYWISTQEKAAPCGTAFYVGGNAKDGPLMRIERTLNSAASNQAYSDGENTLTLTSIPAGDMVIDLNRQTAAVNGQSIMEYFQFGGQFPTPQNGTQTITGTGTVKWRERWE